MGIFDSLVELTMDVATVVTAPIEVALDVADAMVKPLADGVTALKDEVKDLVK